jgi:type III pantothenate kinase
MSDARPGTLIAVDIGNSAAKFHRYVVPPAQTPPQATSSAYRLVQELSGNEWFQDLWQRLAGDDRAAADWWIASVNGPAERGVAERIARFRPHDQYYVITRADVPLEVDVDAPEHVGIDRLLAALAAGHLRAPHRPAIVVNAGSAITVDLLSAAGAFQGGAILPGLRMQAEALHRGTAALPLVDVAPDTPLSQVVGKSTDAAIRSGVVIGTIGAVREIIERLSGAAGTTPQRFFTGGDMLAFRSLASTDAELVPDLVPLGIVLAWLFHAKFES